MGEINGTIQVRKNQTSDWSNLALNEKLRSGDVVRTNGASTGTINFTYDGDNSYLRLDTNTIVELQLGNLEGKTVAQAILDDGQLWGRILTGTGVNLGGG